MIFPFDSNINILKEKYVFHLKIKPSLQIESGMVQKQYIAKVTGVFPDNEVFFILGSDDSATHVKPNM